MAWPNWVSAIGNIVEIGGFFVLAYELRNTNTSAILENAGFRSEKAHADRIIVCDGDGDTAGIFVEGGLVGRLVQSIDERQIELTRSKRLIFFGLIWTGVGIFIQTIGSIAQALTQ